LTTESAEPLPSPKSLLTARATVNWPVAAKVHSGFWSVLSTAPSASKSQAQNWGSLAERSVKRTTNGARPVRTSAVKEIGADAALGRDPVGFDDGGGFAGGVGDDEADGIEAAGIGVRRACARGVERAVVLEIPAIGQRLDVGPGGGGGQDDFQRRDAEAGRGIEIGGEGSGLVGARSTVPAARRGWPARSAPAASRPGWCRRRGRARRSRAGNCGGRQQEGRVVGEVARSAIAGSVQE
jgi:hypothetical protein